MKKLLNILGLIFGIFLLFSCEPGRDENGDLLFGVVNNGGVNTSTATKYLTKITAPKQTGGTYDINFIYTSGLLTGVTTSDNSFYEVITYADSKISKIVKTTKDSGQNVTTTSDFVYSGSSLNTINQKVTKAGVAVNNSVTKFTFNATGKPTRVRTDTFAGNTTNLFSSMTSLIQYSGSNVSKWDATTEFAPVNQVVVPPIVVNAVFSNFDLKHNPFYTLPKNYVLYAVHEEADTMGVYGLCLNNPKTVSGNGNSENILYVYDNDGYPKSMSSQTTSLKFEYR